MKRFVIQDRNTGKYWRCHPSDEWGRPNWIDEMHEARLFKTKGGAKHSLYSELSCRPLTDFQLYEVTFKGATEVDW
jgi:hypothetical protein